MTSFDDREKAAEAGFALQGELEFKAQARRNKLLGLWIAEKSGMSDDEAESYAKDVIASDFDRPGDEDVFEKVWADVQERKLDLSEHQVRRTMEELLVEARKQIMADQ